MLKFLEDAITELDSMDSIISSYKIHLNVSRSTSRLRHLFTGFAQAVNEDITFIQSQDRGLQVQTQNQRALLSELQELLVGDVSWVLESSLMSLFSKLSKLITMRC